MRKNKNYFVKFLISAILLSTLLIFLNSIFNILSFHNNILDIIYKILIIFIVSSAIAEGELSKNLKYLSTWAGIFIIMLGGYTYRYQLKEIKDKIIGELIPFKGYSTKQNSISFPVSSNGHYYINGGVNGIQIRFLADTGASQIVLSPNDAERLGYKLDKLKFNNFFNTANGIVRGATIIIDNFNVGTIHLKKIKASVNEAPMQESLLGMTFFKRLKKYEVKNETLTLYKMDGIEDDSF